MDVPENSNLSYGTRITLQHFNRAIEIANDKNIERRYQEIFDEFHRQFLELNKNLKKSR